MKITCSILFLLLELSSISSQGNYIKLVINEDSGLVRNEEVQKQIESNCQNLTTQSAWNGDLEKCNGDQCKLYGDYRSFSKENLKWIDDVKIETQYDASAGMEVEVIHFYTDGKEVPPKSFLSTQIDKCKAENKINLKGCAQYISELAMTAKSMFDQSVEFKESSQKMMKGLQGELTQEVEDLKGSRSPSDLKKAKLKKDNLNSIKNSTENSTILMPALIKNIGNDYSKISGVSKTINKLEKGL